MIEFEKTYLIKYVPQNTKRKPPDVIIDRYITLGRKTLTIRVRKKANCFFLTKKIQQGESFSTHDERTIKLSLDEFKALSKLKCKVVSKFRYSIKYSNQIAEIDIFMGKLKGLATAEFEFKTRRKLLNFVAPDFCLADVTEADFIAGRKLAGKSIKQIKRHLKKYNYKLLK